MRPARLAIAVLLALVGVIWLGQGSGVLAGSAMSGSVVWAVAGAVLLGLALIVVARERRRPG